MNPNQNPHHNYPGGLPPGQNPNYPGGVNPNFPPQGMPPFGNYPMYQAGVPHPFGQMPPPQPQYPGGPGGADPRIPPDFMNVRIKPEPSWGDAAYGVGPSGSAGNVQGPPQGFGMAGGYPPGFGTRGMPIDLSGDTRPGMPGHYAPPPPPQQQQPGPSTSILAQHLSSAPLPPSQPPQQPPQQPSLSQLLQQQPAYPGGMGGAMGGAMHQTPGGGMVTASGRQVPNNSYEALHLTNIQNRQLMAAQQAYLDQQHQHFQQQQATRAAQLQAEQAAAQAAAQQHAAQQAPPTLHLAPPTQGFPPSASSAHSANSAMRQEATSLFANQLSLPRDSPRHKEMDLNKLTTGELCQYGRDLVNELNYKTSSLSLLLKRVMDRRPPVDGENPGEVAARCRQNLERMVQIRVIIEKRRPPEWKRLTGDDYIEMMLDDSELEKPMDEKRREKRAELERKYPGIMSATQPNDGDVFYQGRWIPEALHQKYMKFEANKILLMNLANDLKNLAWKIDVTSPGHLKRVDQTKISKKRDDGGNP